MITISAFQLKKLRESQGTKRIKRIKKIKVGRIKDFEKGNENTIEQIFHHLENIKDV